MTQTDAVPASPAVEYMHRLAPRNRPIARANLPPTFTLQDDRAGRVRVAPDPSERFRRSLGESLSVRCSSGSAR